LKRPVVRSKSWLSIVTITDDRIRDRTISEHGEFSIADKGAP
jgi:hypothetical protein